MSLARAHFYTPKPRCKLQVIVNVRSVRRKTIKNILYIIFLVVFLWGCSNIEVKPNYDTNQNEGELLTRNYFNLLIKELTPNKFGRRFLKSGAQFEAAGMGINGIEYAITYKYYILAGRKNERAYIVNLDYLQSYYEDFEGFLSKDDNGKKLAVFIKKVGISNNEDFFYKILMPALGEAFRGETINFSNSITTKVYTDNAKSYPQTIIKCIDSDKDIWPKYILSGYNWDGLPAHIWIGFCDEKPYKAYEFGKGWFNPDKLLSETIQKNINFEGENLNLQDIITNSNRRGN